MPENAELDDPVQVGDRREPDRRRERRTPSDDPGTLQVLKPFSPDVWPTQLIDVSRGGLKLRVPEFLQRGTIVQVHFRTTIAIGEVRHCTQTGDEFHIGVKLGEVMER
jgi:hypothetical protein